MKRILMFGLLFVGTTAAAHAQRVEVPQEFIDSANRSFMEVVLLRQAVAAHEGAGKAKDETIAMQKETNKQLLEMVEQYRKMKCDTTTFLWGVIKNKRCH